MTVLCVDDGNDGVAVAAAAAAAADGDNGVVVGGDDIPLPRTLNSPAL
jgi:hypothetical protein